MGALFATLNDLPYSLLFLPPVISSLLIGMLRTPNGILGFVWYVYYYTMPWWPPWCCDAADFQGPESFRMCTYYGYTVLPGIVSTINRRAMGE